jgi:hypothetical protein
MLSITTDTSGLTKLQRFLGAYKNQLPFASSVALNQTARDVQLAYKAQTKQSFIKPVAFTVNAFRYDKSTKANLIATVYPSPDRGYLNTQIFGGRRRWKDYEGLIRGLAASQGKPLPTGKLIPTSLAQNAAGNPKRRLFGELQSKLSTTDRGGYFIGTPRGSGREPGVYRRSRGRLFPYFLVSTSEPNYDKRFPFEKLGNDTVRRVYTTHLSLALDRALASAR